MEKKNLYFIILELLKQNKNPTTISNELNISKQKIYYYTRVLKELGFIEKKGYGTWEVIRSKKEHLEHELNWKDKKIRGHAFIWKIKAKKFDWEQILKKNKIRYNLVRGYTPRIIINNQKIWLGKESIIIYDNHSFYGTNAIQSRKYAVFKLKSILDILQSKLGISLGKYLFKPSREHYGMIKNELARQVNDKGEKIIVRDDLDGEWLWIDDSNGMEGELETGGKGITKDRVALNLEVQNWYNDMKKTNFKVTPTFIIESLGGIVQNQMIFDRNIQLHQSVLEDIRDAIKTLSEEVKKLNNV